MPVFVRLVLLLVGVAAVSACGTAEAEPTSVPPATRTPTPFSTALPDVPTRVPAGLDADNPLQIVLVPAQPDDAAVLEGALEEWLLQETGITVDLVFVERAAQATNALCQSIPPDVALAWLEGFHVAVAVSQPCGAPSLQMERGEALGEPLLLLGNASLEGELQSALAETTFCRVSVTDVESWTLPLLWLRTEGVTNAFAEVVDLDDARALVSAVAQGTCDAVSVTESTYEDALAEDPGLDEQITVLATTLDFPYGVLLVPPVASLTVVEDVQTALLALAAGETTLEAAEDVNPVAVLFGEGRLLAAGDQDFSALAEFVEDTGLNEQLGN